MPLNGNVTLTSLKVRLGLFSLLPVYRLTSGLTVFGGFFKPKQFPTDLIAHTKTRGISPSGFSVSQAAVLKFSSTVMSHSSSNHSGT
jgi:hypothetical protein